MIRHVSQAGYRAAVIRIASTMISSRGAFLFMVSSFSTRTRAARAMTGRFIMLVGLLSLMLAPIAAADSPTAVVISSFTAAYTGGNPINVQWVTESEVDLAMFILYRGQTPLSPAQPGTQVYQVAPQGGGGVGGFTYTFSDTQNLVQGAAYYYMLKVLETTGSEQFFYANNSQPVLFGITPTPTATTVAGATATPTPTATVVTGATATPTPTATVVTGATATPTATSVTGATATPTFTSVPTSTPTPFVNTFPTNTPTPIPGIVTNTPVPGVTATPLLFTATPTPLGTPALGTNTPSPFDTPGIAVTPAVTVAQTFEPGTPGVIEASPTVPLPPATETPTRLPPRTQAQATATPEATGATRTTAATGLLLCLGGGAIFGAGLLAVVGFVLWRRQPAADDRSDDQR